MKDPYVYEDTGTLINKLGIKDYKELRQAEADITFSRLITIEKDVKFKEFNVEYLKNIYKYILGDIFDWAGEFRTVPMEKPEEILGGDTIRYAYPSEIEKQIEKLKNRKVWLKCGGFITIDKTEALTAIDVNTGKYTGNKNLEQTIFKVNKEATVEIAKQIRLRDTGGIIIIDYIDMEKTEDKDRFTKLDLMEMTRKHICSHKE